MMFKSNCVSKNIVLGLMQNASFIHYYEISGRADPIHTPNYQYLYKIFEMLLYQIRII